MTDTERLAQIRKRHQQLGSARSEDVGWLLARLDAHTPLTADDFEVYTFSVEQGDWRPTRNPGQFQIRRKAAAASGPWSDPK